MPTQFKLVLYDQYTNKTLSLSKDSSYEFSITSDTLSKASNRFYIGKFIPKAISPLVNLLTVKIYPNPTKGLLNISLLSNYNGNILIELYDLNGRKVYFESASILDNKIVNISQLQKGIYLLRMNGDNWSYSAKVILN